LFIYRLITFRFFGRVSFRHPEENILRRFKKVENAEVAIWRPLASA